MTDRQRPVLEPFHAMDILARAKALEAQGRQVFHLEVGEPGAPPSPKVRDAVAAVLDKPQRYTLAKGQIELREGLAAYYRAQHGIGVDPEQILVTMGSSAGFILAFLSGFGPGARIAVTRPGYPAYLNILAGLGFEAVEIALSAANGWRLNAGDIAAAHKNRAFDGLLFASPANPTGAAVDAAQLGEIVANCQRLGVRLISDEIYHGLAFEGASSSALEHSDQAIVINSFSKYYCMTGWRVGWLVLPEEMVRRTEILQQNFFISAPTLSQIGALAALWDRDWAEVQKAHYAINRDLVADGLRVLGFDAAAPSDGAFYALVDISEFSTDSMRFCRELLDQTGVALTPGIDFDRTDGHKFVRLSYAGPRATIEGALERLGGFLRQG